MSRTRRQRQRSRQSGVLSAGSEPDPGEQYLRVLIAEQELADAEDVERASDVDDDFEDGGSVLSAAELSYVSDDSISETSSVRDDHDESSIVSDAVDEDGVADAAPPGEIATAGEGEGNGDADPPAAPPALPPVESPSEGDGNDVDGGEAPKVRGRSIGHHLFKQDKLVFVSLDLETGGENIGITQISAEIIRPKLKREGKNTAKDSLVEPVVWGTTQFNEDSNPGGTLFNEYVNPESDAVWNDEAMELTGLSGSDPRISSARGLNDVWASFSKYVTQHIGEDERGVIVAYNGAGSDMKCLWRLTQAPTSTQSMPERLDYYMDPLKIIKKWKSAL